MNILYSFLKQLGVQRISQAYCLQQLLSAPQSDTLLGIKRLLERLGVPTRGVRYDDPQTAQPDFPAIVHLGNSFEVASAKTWPTQKAMWDGIALIPIEFDPDKVLEPDYRKNFLMRFFEGLCLAAVVIIPLLLSFYFAFQHSTLNLHLDAFNLQLSVFLIDLLGIFVGFLLLQKSVMGQSRLGDTLCNVFSKKRSCGDVLNSPAAHILGFSWSEIGFGFFVAHAATLLFMPADTLAFVSLCAMLFAFWSIAYQWSHHSWCALCIITQILLWFEGFLLLFFARPFSVFSHSLSFLQLVVTALFFAFSILIVHFVTLYLSERRSRRSSQWTTKGLLLRRDVFHTLLASSVECSYLDSDINERLGNADIPIDDCLVIYTSPDHCPHCKALLPKEEQFINQMQGRIGIAHINIDLFDPEQRAEVSKRLALNATPRLMFHHHLIPDSYSIEDLPNLL